MFFNWMEDHKDETTILDNQAYLIASFSNPEAVKRILGKDGETISQTDEEFDKNSQELFKQFREEDAAKNPPPVSTRKRKRRKIQE
jgi:hypothetical protein